MCPHTAIHVSSYYYICPHTTIHVSACAGVSSYYYTCVLILLYTCPLLPYMCPYAAIYVSSYYYICVLIPLHMCPHPIIYMCPHPTISAPLAVTAAHTLRIRPHTLAHTSAYVGYLICATRGHGCASVVVYMCPHTTTYVSAFFFRRTLRRLKRQLVRTCRRMLTYADVCGRIRRMQTYAACAYLPTYADVC